MPFLRPKLLNKSYHWHHSVITVVSRGRNNTQSSDMIKCICHLISHKFSQFQVLSGHFVSKKLKIN